MKGIIASSPARNIAELDAKVEEAKAFVTQKSCTNKYRHVQKVEDPYLVAADDDEITSISEDDGTCSEGNKDL
jgi:hypothetical protein